MATTPTNKPIPSEDPRDLKFNAGKIDEVVNSDAHYYTDRFGQLRLTSSGFQHAAEESITEFKHTAEEAIRNYGYITMDSFEDGATLTLQNQTLRYKANGEYYRWDGEFPKVVPAGSTPDSTGEVKLGAWVSVGDASLRSEIHIIKRIYNSVNEMMLDTFHLNQNSLISTGLTMWVVTSDETAIKLKSGLYAKAISDVHTDDFGSSQLSLAIDATPESGTLRLGTQKMIGNLTKRRDNIAIIGNAMPRYANDGKSLIGGSIIKGTFVIDGDGVTCENFGVDCGELVCNEISGGAPLEGFVAHDVTQKSLRKDCHFKNIIGLCRKSTDSVHAVLIEGMEDGSADNIHGRRGFFGVVLKVSRFNVGKVTGYEVGQCGVYIKSDKYAPVMQVNADQLNYFDLGANADMPIAIHASSAALQDVNVAQVNVSGGKWQFRLISNTEGANIIDNVNVASVNARNATEISFHTYGIIYNCNIAIMNLINSASGKYLLTQIWSRNIHIGQVNCIDTLGNNDNEAVKLGGNVAFDKIIACKGYDYNKPMGIYLNTNTPGGLKCRIGDYVGRLNLALSAKDLKNGWVTKYGQEAGCIIKDNRVRFFGRLDAKNVGVDKEVFFTLNSFLTPFQERYFFCRGYAKDISIASNVLVKITNTGNVTFPELNTPRWSTNVNWIDLSGIDYELDDTLY